jgi:sensor histidine kinase YesM
LTYWAIVGVYLAFHYHREYRDRELSALKLQTSLTEARLQALRAQLNPHFLFNTLNAISALALKGDQAGVTEMLGRLSDLLRMALEEEHAQEIPLSREIDFLDRYLVLQRVRFADRLAVNKNIAPETLNALVPPMILQPIVENAIVHGVGARRGRAQLDVVAARDNGLLRLEVHDNGPGFADARQQFGIGLGNTRARLEQLYGTEQRLEYGSAPDGGAWVSITLPFRQIGAGADG